MFRRLTERWLCECFCDCPRASRQADTMEVLVPTVVGHDDDTRTAAALPSAIARSAFGVMPEVTHPDDLSEAALSSRLHFAGRGEEHDDAKPATDIAVGSTMAKQSAGAPAAQPSRTSDSTGDSSMMLEQESCGVPVSSSQIQAHYTCVQPVTVPEDIDNEIPHSPEGFPARLSVVRDPRPVLSVALDEVAHDSSAPFAHESVDDLCASWVHLPSVGTWNSAAHRRRRAWVPDFTNHAFAIDELGTRSRSSSSRDVAAMGTMSDRCAVSQTTWHDINPQDCTTPSFQIGDMIELVGASVESRFKGSSAVITNVYDTHLFAIAVNERGRGVGECWPNYPDVKLVNKSWRVGEHVLVNGMQSKKREAMNGSIGKIVKHPREGHPCFISQQGDASPLLTLCVRLGHSWESKKTVLIEPKYLIPIQLPDERSLSGCEERQSFDRFHALRSVDFGETGSQASTLEEHRPDSDECYSPSLIRLRTTSDADTFESTSPGFSSPARLRTVSDTESAVEAITGLVRAMSTQGLIPDADEEHVQRNTEDIVGAYA